MPSLRDMPKILPPEGWLWRAFCRLSEKRQRIEGTPQPIPESEILAYATYHQIREEPMRDLLYHVVSELDSVYMKFHWEAAAKHAIALKKKSR